MLKKWQHWLILFFSVLIVYSAAMGISSAKEELKNAKPVEVTEKVAPVEEAPEPLTREEEIEAIVEGIVKDDLFPTKADKIAVNKDLDVGGSYIVLPRLSWAIQNSAESTTERLTSFSNHLAAALAKEADVSEVVIFWEVPYHLEGKNIAKFTFKRGGKDMFLEDAWLDAVLD